MIGLCLSVFGNIRAKTKIACIGNSITYGYLLSSPSTQSYPSRLQALLGSEYDVMNFGVSGRTLLKKGDKSYWNESRYAEALASSPDIVVIMLGTNDAKLGVNWTPHKSGFIDDYKALIKSFRDLSSSPEIYICKIIPAYKDIWDISNATIVNEVNPKIEEVATSEGLKLLDMYSAMENKASMFQSDGIHPNATGASEMANYIYSELINSSTTALLLSETENLFNVYHSSFSNSLSLQYGGLTDSEFNISIYSVSGALVYNQSHEIAANSAELNLNIDKEGIYFYCINASNGYCQRGKVLLMSLF